MTRGRHSTARVATARAAIALSLAVTGFDVAPAALAQQPPGQEAPLSLPAAVGLALATSPAIEGAVAQVQGAQERVHEADGAFSPTVSLGVMPIRLGLLNPPDLSAILGAIAPGLAFSPDILSETVTVSQVLYAGGKIGLGQQAARVDEDLAHTRQRIEARDVAFNTANAYLGALRTQELQSAATWGVKQADRHLADARLGEKQGTGTRFDVLQAQAALAAAQTRQVQAEDGVKTTRLALGMMVHQDLGDRPLDPLPVLPDVVAAGPAKERGLAARPEIRALQDQIALARNAAEMKRRDRLPTAAVQGIYGQQGAGPSRFYVILGSLSWTVFDGDKARSEIAQKDLAVESSEDDLASAEDGLRLEIDRALIDRSEARKRMTLSETSLETAQAAYALAQLRFREGASTGTEVIDATTAVVGARNAYIQAMYDELAAEISLAKAVGIDLPRLLSR